MSIQSKQTSMRGRALLPHACSSKWINQDHFRMIPKPHDSKNR